MAQNDTVKGRARDETQRIWDCGSPLYDLHELVSLSYMIEKHFMLIPGASSSSAADSKRFKAHLRGPAKAVTVVGSEIIDGCGGGGGGCGLMVMKKLKKMQGRAKCNKKISYKLKSFARLISF